MDRESVRPSVAPETPLSVTFRDSAFMNFVNDVHPANTLLHQDAASGHAQQRPEGNGARHGANASTNEEEARPPRKAYETPPQQSSSALHDDVPGSSDRPQLGQSASLAPSNNNNNQASLEADDDFFEDLDRLNFTSQALRELTEPDENSFHIREQCNNSASNMLSQDFAEARIDDSDLQKGTTGAGAAKGVRAMSAPGPTISTLAPATPVAGNLAVSVSSVDSNAQSRQTNVAGRGKVNLYPRLAQHIPPRPDSTSYYSQRPPQVGHYGKSATLANDSPTRGSVPRQQQQQRFKPYAHSISNPGFHSGTSSSAPVLAASKQKPPHASTQNTGAEASDALAELARLRAENERMRVEAEQLRAQLYTKEGEVKIVRENLARTEMDNTHLQEQLINQQTGAMAHSRQQEKELHAEIERLRTELVFTQHEAKAEAMAKVQMARAASTPRPVVAAARSGLDVRGVGLNGAPRNGTSSPTTYPSVEDFMSVPKTLPRSAATTETPTLTPSAHLLSSASSKFSDKSTRFGDSSAHADTGTAALLDILSGIAELPNATNFGSLVSLSAQLSRAVRAPASRQLSTFHSMACDALVSSASKSGGFEQLGATVHLLLQAVNSLPEFRAAWLFGATEPPLSSGAELSCISQLSCAAGTALVGSIYTTAKMRTDSSESVVCSAAIGLLCQLLIRLIGLQPSAALSSEMWRGFNPSKLAQYFTRGLCLDGLLGVVGLLTTLIQVSPTTWGYLRGSPGDFERLLLAIMRRLQVASLANDALMLDGKRAFLVLIASAIVTHETDTPVLINSMRRFTMGMVQWFLDEHALLTRRRWAVADSERRVQVFFEYIKCLNVVLSEIKDVVVLLGGDNSPLFFGFVATCTRMTLGEGVFDGVAPIRELAGDLLAYVVTEDQAVSIQNLYI
ncbi:hypothetical protein H4218_005299 [Coemansia sp. IMI 209128]|nr:hypothetical protein H4218_005299 [Coemansia sp. IMI 209128]